MSHIYLSAISYQSSIDHSSYTALQEDMDPTNTTLFVGNLPPQATEAELAHLFQSFGALTHVHIVQGKNCAFVQFTARAPAERAHGALQAYTLHGQALRIAWGRNAAKRARPNAAAAAVPAGYMVPPAASAHGQYNYNYAPFGSGQDPGSHVDAWTAYQAGAQPAAAHADAWAGAMREAQAEGVGYGGYWGHPAAKVTASRFGFEDPLFVDWDGANRRFASVAPPMLAPIAMAPARQVMRAGVPAIV
jgi:RNA recognition motif. (a.k.a. RRM, RBD, or RNP domain)